MSTYYRCRRTGTLSLVDGPTVWCLGCDRLHPVPQVYVPGPTTLVAMDCARCWTSPCLCGRSEVGWMAIHGGRPRQRWAPGVAKAMGKSLALIHDTRRARWPHPATLARGDVDPRAYMGSPADGVLTRMPMAETDQ